MATQQTANMTAGTHRRQALDQVEYSPHQIERGSSMLLTTPSSIGCMVMPATRVKAPRGWNGVPDPLSWKPGRNVASQSTGFVRVVNCNAATRPDTLAPASIQPTARRTSSRVSRHWVMDKVSPIPAINNSSHRSAAARSTTVEVPLIPAISEA
ncbi:hypothetical protein ACFFX0_26975 [Citricoccus parietis]|uniref:Uncharacterized protein n=1 Tax=Citricoccus parietis TaxID=592307 RepID=A0ABV5G6W3_9MICC